MWHKILAAIGVFIVVVFVLGYIKYRQILAGIEQGKNFKLPPEAVTTIIAKKEMWRSSLSAIGTLTPYRGVMITSEEMGKIVEIAFESGQEVKAGDRLVQLDISVEQAQRRSAAARLALAQATLERARALREANANSQLELDQAEAEFAQAEADLKALEARIERKTIRAPFGGKLGLRQVQLGQYVTAGTPIVSLQMLDPIYAEFAVPQFQFGRLRVGQPVDLAIQMDDAKTYNGTITAINPDVDPLTRNLRVQATISNPKGELLPGMFCNVTIHLDEEQEVFPLPQSAIARAPYGDSVYVVKKIKDAGGQEYTGAEQRFVKLGAMRGDQIAVLQGIEPGDEVITSGLFKLRQGAEIFVNNEVQPANEKRPQPANR